jgi:hypothetical protein
MVRFHLATGKRRLRLVKIGTYDISDILRHIITFYCALRCRAGFTISGILLVFHGKLSVSRKPL